MSVTNNSYINSSSDYLELWNYLDKTHIYQLVGEQESEVETTLTDTLISAQQDRLNTALNWGRSLIDSALRELYEVAALTAADAPEIIKDLNARLAQYTLERRRLRQSEATTETLMEIRQELEMLARESSIYTLTWSRKGGITSAVDSKATQFDKADMFGNIIPQSDDGVVWPDLRNQ